MRIKTKKEKLINACIYCAFCMGFVAPAAVVMLILLQFTRSEFLIGVISAAVIVFQIYFLTKIHLYED